MNKFNPNIHHRRSIRLKGYDYSQSGLYFITICCQNRKHRFGEIVGAGFIPAQNNIPAQNDTPAQYNNNEGQSQSIEPIMILNEYGQIAFDEWTKLPERFPNFKLDVFQIMPNHMHGIIALNNIGATLAVTPTVSDIVGAYKSLVANKCLEIYISINETMGKLWQRNFHEHIIRNEQLYNNISEYIINNPKKWGNDKFNNT